MAQSPSLVAIVVDKEAEKPLAWYSLSADNAEPSQGTMQQLVESLASQQGTVQKISAPSHMEQFRELAAQASLPQSEFAYSNILAEYQKREAVPQESVAPKSLAEISGALGLAVGEAPEGYLLELQQIVAIARHLQGQGHEFAEDHKLFSSEQADQGTSGGTGSGVSGEVDGAGTGGKDTGTDEKSENEPAGQTESSGADGTAVGTDGTADSKMGEEGSHEPTGTVQEQEGSKQASAPTPTNNQANETSPQSHESSSHATSEPSSRPPAPPAPAEASAPPHSTTQPMPPTEQPRAPPPAQQPPAPQSAPPPPRSSERFEEIPSRASSRSTTNYSTGSDKYYIVRLRGLPWQVTERDVVEFFGGLKITSGGIYFRRDGTGRTTGEGFVRFDNSGDFEEALRRHRRYMGRRYVEVFSSTVDEWNQAVSGMAGAPSSSPHSSGSARGDAPTPDFSSSGQTYVIRLRGLPYSATMEDVMNFFHGVGVGEKDIFIITRPNGSITGDGYIRLHSPSQASQAMALHNARIGRRYIEIFKSDEGELRSVLARSSHLGAPVVSNSYERESYSRGGYDGGSSYGRESYGGYGGGGGGGGGPSSAPYQSTFALRLRGLPYSVQPEDIATFFAGANIIRDGIHLMQNPSGMLSGDAYVEFASEEDLRIAFRKQNHRIGTRYIELFRVSDEEYNRVIKQQQYGGGGYSGGGGGGYNYNQSPNYDPRMMQSQNAPMDHHMRAYLEAANQPNYMQGGAPADPYGRSSAPPAGYSGSGSSQSYGYTPSGAPTAEDNSLVIRGLTAGVTVADIQRYFQGYSFIPNSIQVASNIERTVFEATLLFSSSSEANRALKEKEVGYIGPSYVKLYKH